MKHRVLYCTEVFIAYVVRNSSPTLRLLMHFVLRELFYSPSAIANRP